jgi:protein ImuA
MDRAALLAGLRARVARLERPSLAEARTLPLAPALDNHLPWGGLPLAALHEVLAAEPGAAFGFAALLLARAEAALPGRALLWIAPDPDAYPPGLARLGLSARSLVLVRATKPTDALWAAEEALRCPAIAATLLIGPTPDLTAARRLQLAAETGGGIGLLLRSDSEDAGPTAALTRWRLTALPADTTPHHLGDPEWQVSLLRARGGRPGEWAMRWDAALGRLEVAGEAPAAGRRRRA